MGGEWSTSCPGQFFHLEITPVPFERRLGGLQSRCRYSGEKCPTQAGILTLDHPAFDLVTILTTLSWHLNKTDRGLEICG
jgi:hypothetical protein